VREDVHMKWIFIILVITPILAFASTDNLSLSAYISQSEHQLLDTDDIENHAMVETAEQSLTALIESQGFDAQAHETESLPVLELLDVDSINLEHSFINTMTAQGQDSADFADQARADADNNNCGQSDDETTVCTNIMCTFGIVYGEWSQECTDNVLDMVLLRATTPPWDSLPTCKMVDELCNQVGRASRREASKDFCHGLSTEKRHSCLLGLEIGEEEAAIDYIERNNGDEELLETAQFERPHQSDEVQQETQDYSTSFLAVHVDPRYAQDETLFEDNGNYVPGQRLGQYLEARESGRSVLRVRQQLIRSGELRAVCADVPVDQFYNCNQFPDLPEQCWLEPNHESIVECLRQG